MATITDKKLNKDKLGIQIIKLFLTNQKQSSKGLDKRTILTRLNKSYNDYYNDVSVIITKLQYHNLIYCNTKKWFLADEMLTLSAKEIWSFTTNPFPQPNHFYFYRKEWRDNQVN